MDHEAVSPHWSLSQARLALSCPLAWWNAYKSGQERPQAGDAALAGSHMDELLNFYFGPEPTLRKPMGYFSDEVLRDYEAIVAHYAGDLDGIAQPQVPISITVPGIPIPVIGFADLVAGSTVYEHKRGGGWDDAWWSAARRQVALYADALGKSWGTIIQVKDGRVNSLTFSITPDLVRSVHDELRAGWVAASQCNDMFSARVNATPGKSCAWCSYEPECPESVFRGLK